MNIFLLTSKMVFVSYCLFIIYALTPLSGSAWQGFGYLVIIFYTFIPVSIFCISWIVYLILHKNYFDSLFFTLPILATGLALTTSYLTNKTRHVQDEYVSNNTVNINNTLSTTTKKGLKIPKKEDILSQGNKAMHEQGVNLVELVKDIEEFLNTNPNDKEINQLMDDLVNKYGPCVGIPEGQCRE